MTTKSHASHITWSGLKTTIQWIDRAKAYDYKQGNCSSKLDREMLPSRSVI